jgi:excinuclease ABC subunit C
MKLSSSLHLPGSSQAESSLDACPSQPAVFAIYFDELSGQKVPPYLGRTSDLHRRLARLLGNPRPGSRLLNLHEQARRVEYSRVGSSLEALWLLYHLHKAYYPRTYRQRLRLKPPALLKLNTGNRYPRLYPTRRLSRDGSVYYGPFPSRIAAERFANQFLDLFKIRRCVEDLNPDPSHPGCIYSQMKMCLAPCFQGCTDDEYRGEVGRVTAFLDGAGKPLVRELEAQRAQASEALDFEHASRVHSKIEKVSDVLRSKPDLARNLRDLNAALIVPGGEAKSVAFFRIAGGELRGPAKLSLDENVPLPVSLDEQIRGLLEPLASPQNPAPPLPPWEHLSLIARWYYSSFRTGEIVMLDPVGAGDQNRPLPTRALIRACRKVLALENA